MLSKHMRGKNPKPDARCVGMRYVVCALEFPVDSPEAESELVYTGGLEFLDFKFQFHGNTTNSRRASCKKEKE